MAPYERNESVEGVRDSDLKLPPINQVEYGYKVYESNPFEKELECIY